MTRPLLISLVAIAALTSCPGDTGDPQLPPTNASSMAAWLEEGSYTSWRCESAPHDARSPSPHGRNRVCNNDAVVNHTGSGPYPVCAANVKELVDAQGAITGYTVSRRVAEGSDPSAWYWYERLGSNVVADGRGVASCTACHSAAGSDAQHSGQDNVYTRVP